MRLTLRSGAVVVLASLVFAPLQAQNNSQAVIIEGWRPAEAAGLDWLPVDGDTFNELWNDCFLMYELMYKRQATFHDTSRIRMLWGVGQPWPNLSPRYDPQGWLGLNRVVDDSATVNTIGNTFAQLADTMGSGDSLFCYTWGHGGKDSAKTHFCLYVAPIVPDGIYFKGDTLWDTTFARMVSQVPGKRAFIMQQCHGGGFMDDLADSNTVMVCAAAAGKSAYSADDDSKHGSPLPEHEVYQGNKFRHCEFNFHFMNALRGTAIWGNNGYGDPPVVDADTNNDSMVSWREAYDYTKYHDSKEDPVFFGEDSFWMVEPDVPTWASNKKVRTGGALATELTNQTLVYGFKGNNTCEFFVFDPAKDSWFEREMIPHTGSTGNRKVSSGGTLASVGNGKLYATKGKCLEFWKFDDSCLAGSKWTEMPSVPAGLKSKGPKDGASAVAVSLNDTPYIYLLKANNTLEFYRFNTVTGARDTTCSLAQPPEGTEGKKFKAGSCMAFDGYDTIYAVKGTRSSTTQYFPVYAYSVRGDAWCSMPGLPLTSRKTTATGSAMAFLGNNLYVAKGKTLEMWVYRRADGNWHRMQSMPSGPSGKDRVYTGCALASDGNFIWAFKGGNSKDFYRFTPNRCPGESQSSPTPPVAGGNELLLAEDGDAEDVRWSNSGEWVAFTAPDDSGRRQVFKVAVGGGDPQQLTSLAGECARPVWSDNDSTIAFEATPDTGAYCQIATVPAVGGSMSYMTSSPQDKWHLTWSPSGMLAFLSNDSMGYAQVYTLDGLNSVVGLTQEPTEHESPEFASTMEIVYTREGDNGYAQLYVIRIDSLEETALTSSLRDHSNLAPAPGAGFVFCEVVDANGYSQIAAVPVGGGAETDLTSESYDFESPTTNSDATAIFCTQSSGPGSALCRVYPSGGWEQLTDEEVERLTPHAQPSGLTLSAAYVRDGDVYRLSEVARKSQQSAGQVPLALSVAEPNPGRDRVTIRWQVSAFCDVSLRVYNAAGQLVKVLADGRTKPGAYTSVWNGTDAKGRRLATGVYFCALEDGAQRISRKVVLTE